MVDADPRRAALVAFLADRDVPCPECAYNLRDLATSRCPECGLALRLPLKPRPYRGLGWWLGLAGIVGTAASLVWVLVVAAARGYPMAIVIAVVGLASMVHPARRWLRTPRALTELLTHKIQERVAVWWFACLLAALFAWYTVVYR